MSVMPMRVVILGGAFAGVSTALELGRLTKGDQKAEVHRLRCPDVHLHCASVDDVGFIGRTMVLSAATSSAPVLPYGHLICCLGLKMNLSKVPGITEHAFSLKTLWGAFELRNHIVGPLGETELDEDAVLRQQLLTSQLMNQLKFELELEF